MFILYPTRMIIVKDSVGDIIRRIMPNNAVKNRDHSKSMIISKIDEDRIYGLTSNNGKMVDIDMDIDHLDDFMFGENNNYDFSIENTIDWVLYSVETKMYFTLERVFKIYSLTHGIYNEKVEFKKVKRGNSGTTIILEYVDGRGVACELNNPNYTASIPLKDIKYIPFFDDYHCTVML